MRSNFECLVLEKTLSRINTRNLGSMADVMDSAAFKQINPESDFLRNVCARLPVPLADEIDRVVDLLGVTKRRFLTDALTDAVMQSVRIMVEEGLIDETEGFANSKLNFGQESEEQPV
jgi:hypothetical protein